MTRALAVLIAPDSFKGSLSAVEVADALAAGWRRERPDDRIELAPLADGGEGTIDAIEAAGGWQRRSTEVIGPMLRPTLATWLLSDDRSRACIEMAQGSGLTLVPVAERDTRHATSYGTGQLIRAALDAGATRITLGIGGSATTDGGSGMLQALGAVALSAEGVPLATEGAPMTPLLLDRVARVDLLDLDPRLADSELLVACDVANPLLGVTGAAAIFGPQKGATPDVVRWLDARLAVWARALDAATGRSERETAGAGAAGGMGYALLSVRDRVRSFALRPGVELVMEATGFEEKLAVADLVLTGEGRIDESTAFGKTALGVARRAHGAGIACIAIGGGVTKAGIDALREVGAVAVPVIEAPMTVEAAIALGEAPVESAGARLAALVTIGSDAGVGVAVSVR